MLVLKSLFMLSFAFCATTTAIPHVDVADVDITGNQTTNHTEITNDSAIFQPLTKCDNEYSTIDVRANNLRGVPGLTKYLASIIKQQSNKNSCRRIGDRFNNDIRWEYEATTSGGNCKTSASESPGLTDAVQGFLNWMTDHNVDKACVKMNNCGTWRGILQIADHRKGISPGLCYDRFKG